MVMKEYDVSNLGSMPFINSAYLLTSFVNGSRVQQGEGYKERRKGQDFKNQRIGVNVMIRDQDGTALLPFITLTHLLSTLGSVRDFSWLVNFTHS